MESNSTNTGTNLSGQDTTEKQPGQAEGTMGKWVKPETATADLPLDAEGNVKWAEAGMEVLDYKPSDPAVPEKVQVANIGSANMPVLRVVDPIKALLYLGTEAVNGALDGNGLRVKGQDVARSYAKWLHEQKVQKQAWDSDTGLLTGTYRVIYLQKVWARYCGITLERRVAQTKVVEKIVEVRSVALPNGEIFTVDPKDETTPEMQLFSAYLAALMDDEDDPMDQDDAMEKCRRFLDNGKFARMLEKGEAKKE